MKAYILQFLGKFWCFDAFSKAFQIEENRRYSNNIVPAHPGKPRLFNFWCKTFFSKCLPNGISNGRYSNTFFLSTPARPDSDSLILCAKLGVLRPSQRHFKQKIFKYIIPANPWKRRFYHFMCKTRCFDAFPHVFQIEDIQIHDSCPLLQVQIRQFYVQNSVVWCLPKSISNRRYSNNIVPAHPWKRRFSNVLCKTRCFDAFPKALQITYIQIYYSCPPLTAQILQVQNRLFWSFSKSVLNRKYSNLLLLHHPWKPRYSPILRAKLAVLRLSHRHFNQKYIQIIVFLQGSRG